VALTVIQQNDQDYRSLFTAARVHSRLHAAVGRALTSITTTVQHGQQLSSLLKYLTRHAQHIKAMDLTVTNTSAAAEEAAVRAMSAAQADAAEVKAKGAAAAEAAVPFMLPSNLELDSLSLTGVVLRSPADLLGILPAGAPIKQLRLDDLRVQLTSASAADAAEALATTLLGLPQLNHLSIIMRSDSRLFGDPPAVTAAVTFPGECLYISPLLSIGAGIAVTMTNHHLMRLSNLKGP
jgi:hypothetical protein